MKEALIDTDILSYYFKGDTKVIENFNEYLKNFDKINLSIISYYEIISGLKFKDSLKYLAGFSRFVTANNVLPLTMESVEISSNLYSELRKEGKIIEDIDLLIAGIAISKDLIFVTNNIKHFSNIKKLTVMNWKN